MGMYLYAKLMFGYPAPELDHDDLPAWYDEDDGLDLEHAWFYQHGPVEVKDLNLSEEEMEDWNLSERDHSEEDKARFDAYSARYREYLDARHAWLQKNPCPVHLEYIGSYDEGEHFLVVCHEGVPVLVETCWTTRRITREDLKEPMSRGEATALLNDFCTSIGLPVNDEPAGWFLAPLYG